MDDKTNMQIIGFIFFLIFAVMLYLIPKFKSWLYTQSDAHLRSGSRLEEAMLIREGKRLRPVCLLLLLLPVPAMAASLFWLITETRKNNLPAGMAAFCTLLLFFAIFANAQTVSKELHKRVLLGRSAARKKSYSILLCRVLDVKEEVLWNGRAKWSDHYVVFDYGNRTETQKNPSGLDFSESCILVGRLFYRFSDADGSFDLLLPAEELVLGDSLNTKLVNKAWAQEL